MVTRPNNKPIDGIRLTEPKPSFYYRSIQKNVKSNSLEPSTSNSAASGKANVENINFVEVRNSYDALRNENVVLEPADEGVNRDKEEKHESDDDEVEIVYDETAKFMDSKSEDIPEGASTPVEGSLNV